MNLDQFEISEIASKLKNGSLALFPTDTLPAICSIPEYAKNPVKLNDINANIGLM